MPNLSLETKNIFMLVSTGMMFPLAVGISTLLKADWKLEDNPLNMLGLIINLAQFAYFPFIFWAFAKSPEPGCVIFRYHNSCAFFPIRLVLRVKSILHDCTTCCSDDHGSRLDIRSEPALVNSNCYGRVINYISDVGYGRE